MNLLTPDFLKLKAIQWCEENMHGWKSLSRDEQQWYIQKTIDLFLEREDLKKYLFKDMLN